MARESFLSITVSGGLGASAWGFSQEQQKQIALAGMTMPDQTQFLPGPAAGRDIDAQSLVLP